MHNNVVSVEHVCHQEEKIAECRIKVAQMEERTTNIQSILKKIENNQIKFVYLVISTLLSSIGTLLVLLLK